MVTRKSNPNIIRHESTHTKSIITNEETIKLLKDEIREYKRQIKVLKNTIENLKSNSKQ